MLYADRTGTALCVGPEAGEESFCGKHDVQTPITETVDDVYGLFGEVEDGSDILNNYCDCRAQLLEYLGVADEDELAAVRRRRSTRRALSARRQG
jgi:hypothetical protein